MKFIHRSNGEDHITILVSGSGSGEIGHELRKLLQLMNRGRIQRGKEKVSYEISFKTASDRL